MTSLDSLYRVEDGYVLIEMKLSSMMQLYNSLDPAPFHEKELDLEAETYIVDTVKDFSSKTRFRIVIYLPDSMIGTKEAMDIPKAIMNHFEYRAMTQRRKFRERYVYGQFALVVGLSFLAVATLASLIVDSYSSVFPAARLIANALEITGWVAMWEPVTVFLFQLWPIFRQRKVYEMISRMEIDIRPYGQSIAGAPEILAKAQSY